jgi:hypothetical protein
MEPTNQTLDGVSHVDNNYLTVKDTFPTLDLSDEINICVFMPSNKTANPAVISRHHIYPIPHLKYNKIVKAERITYQDPNYS